MLKRIFDLLLALIFLIIFLAPMLLVGLFIKLTSKGPCLYWSKRIGQNNKIFEMPKFRTMKIDTPQLATHLLTNANNYLIKGGSLIRKLSLDELPQLYSVFVGDMSFVGPRPALFNQHDLVQLRTEKNVHLLVPGITGWAQINGRDEIPIPQKVLLDEYYLIHQSLFLDFKILFLTAINVIIGKDVSH